MKKLSLKSRFIFSMLIVFFLSLIPFSLLIIQNHSQESNHEFLQLSKQVNLLLSAADIQRSELKNDSIDIAEIFDNIRLLDSIHQFNLPLAAIENVVNDLKSPQNVVVPVKFNLNIFEYPGIINDTLIVNSQVNEWLNNAYQNYLQQNPPETLDNNAVAQLNDLFYPFYNNIKIESTDKQSATTTWIIVFGWLGLAFLVSMWLIYDYIRKLTLTSENLNNKLKDLSEGNIPKNNDKLISKELEPGLHSINQLSEQFELIYDFAIKSSKGSFEQMNIFEKQGKLGKAMADMTESLQEISTKEERRRWANEGVASFANILRRYSDDLEKLSHEILVHLIKYINACQGGVFVVSQNDDQEAFLELTACYAYERKKFIEKRIEPGQSLVGQCYLEKKSTYLKNVPNNYIQIKSGMGGANPQNIFIVPLISNDEIYGVIEIASFKEITDFQQEFIERNAESIASAIAAVKLNENTKKLLQESQMATEQLRAQEEEMRQNMEELAATQEEMKRRQDELLNNEAKTKLIYENAFDGIIITNDRGDIELFNPACAKIFGYTFDEVKDQNVKILMPDDVAQKHDAYIDNHQKNGSKGIVGQTRLLTGRRKDGDLFPVRIKLDQAMVSQQKVFILFLEDLSQEENLKNNLKSQNETLERNKYNLLSLINNSEDTIFAIDKDYQILVVNEKLKNKYARVNIELQEGQNILELLPEEQIEIWKDRYDRALSGERYTFTETKNKPDGTEELLEVFIRPINDNEGNVIGASVTARDITAYGQNGEKQQEQIQAIQDMVGRLKKEKQNLSEKLANAQYNSEFDVVIKEQINNHEYMLQKLQENQQKLKAAMQDEKYIMKKSASG